MNIIIPKINQIIDPKTPPGVATPLSKEEICAFNSDLMEFPVLLGAVQDDLARLYGRSLIYYLTTQGRELYESGHAVVIKEPIDNESNVYEYPNLISRSGNTFTLNTDILDDDTDDTGDTCVPDLTKLKFVVIPTQEVTITDGTKRENGTVTEVSEDGKTITVAPLNGADWTIGTADLDIIVLSPDMDWEDCGSASCVNPTSILNSNYFRRSVDACKFNEGELLNRGNCLGYENGRYFYDKRMDQLKLDHLRRIGETIVFGHNAVEGSQAKPLGVGKMFSMLDQLLSAFGALKVDGYIETRADFSQLIAYLRKYRAPYTYTIRADSAQYSKLQSLITEGMQLTYDPFDTRENMARFSFSGIEIENYQFYFTVCDILATGGFAGRHFEKTTPKFIMIPEGTVPVIRNNQRKDVGYMNIVWNQSDEITYKAYKRVDPLPGCPYMEVKYDSSYTNLIVQRQKWIIGI